MTQASEQSKSSASGTRLVGGITHSEKLAPMEADERPGASAPIDTSAALPNRRPAYQAGQAQTQVQQVDQSKLNVAAMQREAALKSQPAKLDPAVAAYKKQMQQVIAGGLKQSRTGQAEKLRVPDWLAGVWQRDESNETSRVELPGGRALNPLGRQTARVVDTFGTMKDKKGAVWMLKPTGAAGAVDRGAALDYHRVRQYQLIVTGPRSCLVKVRASHYVVDKQTSKIVSAYQDEEFNTYSLVSPGVVKTESSVKVFDENGAARLLTRATSMTKRISTI